MQCVLITCVFFLCTLYSGSKVLQFGVRRLQLQSSLHMFQSRIVMLVSQRFLSLSQRLLHLLVPSLLFQALLHLAQKHVGCTVLRVDA